MKRRNHTFLLQINQQTGQGRASLQAAANLIDGKPIAEGTGYEVDDENEFIIWVPFEPVTVDNVADYD